MILVFGSINADLSFALDRLPVPGQTVLAERLVVQPGGKGANQAVAARRDGASVVMVGAVTATVGTAAAVKFGLRLRRRAVTTAEVAAVGMTAMGMVAGKAIEPGGWAELFAKPVVFAKGN